MAREGKPLPDGPLCWPAAPTAAGLGLNGGPLSRLLGDSLCIWKLVGVTADTAHSGCGCVVFSPPLVQKSPWGPNCAAGSARGWDKVANKPGPGWAAPPRHLPFGDPWSYLCPRAQVMPCSAARTHVRDPRKVSAIPATPLSQHSGFTQGMRPSGVDLGPRCPLGRPAPAAHSNWSVGVRSRSPKLSSWPWSSAPLKPSKCQLYASHQWTHPRVSPP